MSPLFLCKGCPPPHFWYKFSPPLNHCLYISTLILLDVLLDFSLKAQRILDVFAKPLWKRANVLAPSMTSLSFVQLENGLETYQTVHNHCPLDYCTSERNITGVAFLDDQCNFNHSGILFGECHPGFSLILKLGSSKCEHCSNIYLLFTLPFALAGLSLVLLYSCNLSQEEL